jgi:hypothetical protein
VGLVRQGVISRVHDLRGRDEIAGIPSVCRFLMCGPAVRVYRQLRRVRCE